MANVLDDDRESLDFADESEWMDEPGESSTETPGFTLSGFQEDMLATLRSGGSVKVTSNPAYGTGGMAAEQQAGMDELVSLGLARRSNSGRYWSAEASGDGRPEIGPAINVRLGEMLEGVDANASRNGIATRAAAIRHAISRGINCELNH